MRWVVLPQALRIIIPPIGNQFIGMLKLSALASVIGVQELLLVADQTASSNFRYFETLTAAGIYYLVMTTLFMAVPVVRSSVICAAGPGSAARWWRCRPARSSPMTAWLSAAGLCKRFGSLDVLQDVELAVHPRECLVILGPSGSGKSTLLRCPNLLEPIAGGSILFEGNDIARTPRRQAAPIRRRMGMVFQNFELFPHLSAAGQCRVRPDPRKADATAAGEGAGP